MLYGASDTLFAFSRCSLGGERNVSLNPVASYKDMARAQALGTPNKSSLLIGQFLINNRRT